VQPADADWLPQLLDATPGVVAGLRTAVEESLVGDRLPIRDRERLIRRALHLGLNRFEANLLIATVQHRARESASANQTSFAQKRRRWNVGSLLMAALIIELAAILLLARVAL
jgi:hypothetical protein